MHVSRKASTLMFILVTLIAVFGVCVILNKTSHDNLPEMVIVYEDNPAFFFSDMKLIWDDVAYRKISYAMRIPNKGKQIGVATDKYGTWKVFELNGYSHDYLLAVDEETKSPVVLSSLPKEEPWRQYIIENSPSSGLQLRSVSLFSDGTATIAIPPVSSTFIGWEKLTYTLENEILSVNRQSGNLLAQFVVVDEDTIQFRESTYPIFAQEGALYHLKI